MNDNHRPTLRIVCSCAAKVHEIREALGGEGFEICFGPSGDGDGDSGEVHVFLGSLLTDSEKRVLQYVADNSSMAGIGKELGVSAETVCRHLMHIRKKIGVETTVQAIVWALRHGVID